MKKIYMFLLIGIFLLINGEISKSQPPNFCPPDYTQMIVNIPVVCESDTCVYEVILCVKCNLGTSPESIVEKINVHAMRPLDSLCQCDPTVVMNTIIQTINDPDWIYVNIIPYCTNGWPPCEGMPPVPPIEIIYSFPICWQWDYFQINEDPPEWVKVKIAGCDCFCIWSNLFCWDSQQGKLIKIADGQAPQQEGDCPCLDPEYPPAGPCWSEPSPCSE